MDEQEKKTYPGLSNPPTNRYAAKRPYCKKHSRAMLDIGGTKKCPTCMKEESAADEAEAVK